MGAPGAAAARTRPGGPGAAGHRRFARDRQRAAVYQTNRLPLALPAARSAAPLDGALLLREVDGRRDTRRGQPAPAGTESAAGRARRAAHGRDPRQPDRQERRSDPGRGLGWREMTEGAETPRAGGYRRLVVGRVGAGGGRVGSRW